MNGRSFEAIAEANPCIFFFNFGNSILLDFGTAILVRYAAVLLGLGTEILVVSAHKYQVNSALAFFLSVPPGPTSAECGGGEGQRLTCHPSV